MFKVFALEFIEKNTYLMKVLIQIYERNAKLFRSLSEAEIENIELKNRIYKLEEEINRLKKINN